VTTTIARPPGPVTRTESADATPVRGTWFWVADDEGPWLGCVTHVGSNYVEVEGPRRSGKYLTSRRVHMDAIATVLTTAPDAATHIAGQIAAAQAETRRLVGAATALAQRLSLTAIGDGGGDPDATEALAVRTGEPIADYKQALITAKETTLPELFKAIEATNDRLGVWMKAELIPLQAEAAAIRPILKAVEARIFHVELYAGLVETIEQIQDGPPAPADTPLHLFQRRAYMDEECLARYEAGGMEFKDLATFEAWLLRPGNLDRLLPHPRCAIAFRVRRTEKEHDVSLREWIKMSFDGIKDLDKRTFLYIRNGAQVARLNTGIDFGEHLFPDVSRSHLDGVLYGEISGSRCDRVLSEGDYLALVAEDAAEAAALEAAKAEAKRKHHRGPMGWLHERARGLVKWSPDTVYYDDITAFVRKLMDDHNRLVLVLQGLFDRSPVLHPHPPAQLWSAEGFARAVTLVYDDTRGLTSGDAPDFEAYRRRLNASLAVGSVTVGQEDVWMRHEAEKENARQEADYRVRNKSEYKRYRPCGNPGPGVVATVTACSPRHRCTYRWFRERLRRVWGEDDNVPCAITVNPGELLHINAYTPGDYRQFYDDPRTRAQYLQWAPLLLVAEDYHAGKHRTPPPPAEDDDA